MSPSTRVGGGWGATRVAGGHTGGMRHELDPDRSTVTVHASSSLHPITTDAPVTGWIDVAVDADGRLDAGAPVDGAVEVALGTMRSGNPLIDREAERRLHIRRHPTVTGRLTSLSPGRTDADDAGGADDDDAGWAGAGALDFHGVTRPLEGVLRLTLLPDGEIGLKGSAELDVTDFDVQPPSLLVVKVHPQIRVELDAVAFPARNLS